MYTVDGFGKNSSSHLSLTLYIHSLNIDYIQTTYTIVCWCYLLNSTHVYYWDNSWAWVPEPTIGEWTGCQNDCFYANCWSDCTRCCDIPAGRKTCGHNGCSKCQKVFPANKDYSGFNRSEWKHKDSIKQKVCMAVGAFPSYVVNRPHAQSLPWDV